MGGMNPGILALVSLFTTPIGGYIIAKSGLIGGIQHVMDGQRGDNTGYLKALMYGGLVGGGTITLPLWINSVVGAASGIIFGTH